MMLALALSLLVSSPARAFTLEMSPTDGTAVKGWGTRSVTVDYNFSQCPQGVDTDGLAASLNNAVALWNGVPTSGLKLSVGTSSQETAEQAVAQTAPGNAILICDPDFEDNTGTNGDFVPAATSFIFDTSSYKILFAYTLLNADTSKNANISNVIAARSNLIDIIFAHEIGHEFGLGHSSDLNALMYYDATQKTSLGLAQDDTDAVTFLYPRFEGGNALPFGCGTLARPGDSGRGGDGAGQALAFAMMLGACWAFVRLARPTYVKRGI
jgi:hypothetical protein